MAVLIIASITDLRSHRISNRLTYSTMIFGIVYYTLTSGMAGFLQSLGGLFLGLAVLIVFYLLGVMGAGDVKLMAAVGSLLGPQGVFEAFLGTALAGGIYAFLVLAAKGYLRDTLKRFGLMIKTFFLTKKFIYIPPQQQENPPLLCYGVAISLGTMASLAFRML
jgi:prepilin peptidase CpaA